MQKQLATASKEMRLDKPILQRQATPRNTYRRIVPPKGVGSSPISCPNRFRIRKGATAVRSYRSFVLRFMFTTRHTTAQAGAKPEWHDSLGQ